MKRFLGSLLMLSIVGCAPWGKVGGIYKSRGNNYSVDLPEGWMRQNYTDYLHITRDGVLLQGILIERIDVDEELKYTKKTLKEGALPQEVAEVIIDNQASNPDQLNYEILENVPSVIDGYPGFRFVFTYKTKDALRYKGVYYGFLLRETFYGISYAAPQRHYFENDLETFGQIVHSFKLLNPDFAPKAGEKPTIF